MELVRSQELALVAEKRNLRVDREAEQKELANLRARCKKLQGQQVALQAALRSKTQMLETVVVCTNSNRCVYKLSLSLNL